MLALLPLPNDKTDPSTGNAWAANNAIDTAPEHVRKNIVLRLDTVLSQRTRFSVRGLFDRDDSTARNAIMKLLQRRLSIRAQLLVLFGLLLGTGFCVLVMDELELRDEISTFDALLRDSLSGLRLAKSISDSYRLEIVDTTFRVRNSLLGWDQGARMVDTAQSDIQRHWQALLETNLSPEQRALANEIAKARTFADGATRKLRTILQAQDIKALFDAEKMKRQKN